MRAWKLALAVLALGCSQAGTQALPVEAGLDATTPGDDASGEGGSDGGEEAEAEPMCTPLAAPEILPSQDCVFAGNCPEACSLGASAAYACIPLAPIGDAAVVPAYPGTFTAPIGIVNVIALEPGGYPWGDAAAFVSCGPLSCVRWTFGDHVDGSSAWVGDPCGDGGNDTEAWSCPLFAGLAPPVSGCFDTGGLGAIGGADTGVPAQNVWCCPGPGDGGTMPIEASVMDSASAEDGSGDGSTDGGAAQDAPGE